MNEIRPIQAAGLAWTDPFVCEMDAELYHRDPCPTPSLSAGMINDMLVAPAKCFHNARRLNPEWEAPEKQEKFSVGSVSHILLLEPEEFERRVVIVRGKTKDGRPSEGYSSQDAKDQRDEALAAGKTPILPGQLDEVMKARDAFFANAFTKHAFMAGRFEQAMFWRHPTYGFWCRARPDFIADSMNHLCDYKATANADPAKFGKHAFDMGYHRRAAWYLDGAKAVFGKEPAHYWFCSQETKAPYLTAVVELDLHALEAGRAENERAAALFDRCLKSGDWFGYRHAHALDRDLAFQVGLPTWALMQIDQRTG